MNYIAVIVLIAFVCELILNIFADFLNLQHFSPELPEAFRDIYDAKRYADSQNYLYENTRFGWIESIVNLGVLLCFWFDSGFNALDHLARGFNRGPVISGLIFIGLLLFLRALINLPFSIYRTFVIEEKFGFNKTGWKTFAADHLKGFGLAVILGGPLLAAVLAFFEYAGGNAWWYSWAAVSFFMLLVRFIGPTWIMPLFNRFSPLEEGELRQALMAFAKRIRFPLKNIFLMDGSRRSSKSNAYFTGFGRNKRIVLFDTLVGQTTTAELVGILAHEMGHYKLRHIWTDTIIGILHSGILFFLLSIFISLPSLFNAFYMDVPSAYGGLIFFGILYSPVEFFLGILLRFHSRRIEYQADRFALETTFAPQALTSALKKLSVQNLSNLTPHPFYVMLNYSHPPILERINAIATLAAQHADERPVQS